DRDANPEPPKTPERIVERAAPWLQAPGWAVVSSTSSGQLTVLDDRGLTPGMAAAGHAIARWVMDRGEDFVTADLGRDARLTAAEVGAAMAFALSCRGRRVGALVALDRQASAREPRMAAGMRPAIRG